MAIEIETSNCTSLKQFSLEEIAVLSAESSNGFDVDFLSAQAENWVLLTTACEADELKGFSFSTLDRIGGTPCVLIGAGYVCRTDTRSQLLEGIISDQMRRASLSFPDEDVLFGAQVNRPGAFEVFSRFHDVVPRPDFKPVGEDRAWGRRLAKRFGISIFGYDDRTFINRTKKWPPEVFDHVSLKSDINSPDIAALLEKLNRPEGDTVLVHGWARAEQLEALI